MSLVSACFLVLWLSNYCVGRNTHRESGHRSWEKRRDIWYKFLVKIDYECIELEPSWMFLFRSQSLFSSKVIHLFNSKDVTIKTQVLGNEDSSGAGERVYAMLISARQWFSEPNGIIQAVQPDSTQQGRREFAATLSGESRNTKSLCWTRLNGILGAGNRQPKKKRL